VKWKRRKEEGVRRGREEGEGRKESVVGRWEKKRQGKEREENNKKKRVNSLRYQITRRSTTRVTRRSRRN
jgi:hypothetical protein